MERRYEPQTTYAEEQEQSLLPPGKDAVIASEGVGGTIKIEMFWQLALDEYRRDYRCDNGWQYQSGAEVCCRNRTLSPYHKAGNVAYHCPAPSTTCSNNDCRTDIHALLGITYNLAKNHQHQHGDSKVIYAGTEQERHRHGEPEHLCRAPAPEQFLHEGEALVVSKNLHYRHGGKEVEHKFAYLTYIAKKYVFGNVLLAQKNCMLGSIKKGLVFLGMDGIDERSASTHEQDPSYRTAEHSNKGFVYMCYMFRSNEQVTKKNNNNYGNRHLEKYLRN
jgi:hypothetical protein